MVQENSPELFRMPSRQLLIFAVAESTFCSRRLTAYQIEYIFCILYHLEFTLYIYDRRHFIDALLPRLTSLDCNPSPYTADTNLSFIFLLSFEQYSNEDC